MPASTGFEFYDLLFRSEGLEQPLTVSSVDGDETMSDLWSYQIVFSLREHPLLSTEMDAVLTSKATLSFRDGEHAVHGVVSQITMLPGSHGQSYRYLVEFVPRLWYATQTSGSWVYTDMSLPDILRDVLKENGLAEGSDFELRLSSSYPKLEYTVQYQETDYHFIARLMEHEGIFFYWDHTDGVDKLLIGDANAVFTELAGHEVIRFDPRGNVSDPEEMITSASHMRQSIPRTVVLKDFNYRTPALQLRTGLTVDAETGHGTQVRFGDHFKDIAGGKRIARLRAEELYMRRELFEFTSRVRGIRPGHKFTLSNALVPEMDREYIVIAVSRSVVQAGLGDSGTDNRGYANVIKAIDAVNAYRPPLKTPKPRIHGHVQAKIDGIPMDDGTTPIDEMGRYKIAALPDCTRARETTGSRWVRRAQPYSGQDYGMHFPLHVGTEVMLGHVDGDPDRPIIVGTVANPENGSPVTRPDSQRSRIKTRSRIVMGWHDRRG